MKQDIITKDIITVEIISNSEECEQLREDGVFFDAIINALWLKRKDIKEINRKEKYDKSRSNLKMGNLIK